MNDKIVLTKEQKEILVYHYDLPYDFTKKKLELLVSKDGGIYKWELTDGSKKLGSYLSDYAVEQIVALLESRITYQEIILSAKVGDKLQGHFYLNTEYGRRECKEIIINDEILLRLKEADIREGARYYLKRLDEGYKYMVIVKR